MTCPEAHLDGSFVLGALAPAERAAYARHLLGCRECAASVERLAAVPGLLARVRGGTTDVAAAASEWLPVREAGSGLRSLAGDGAAVLPWPGRRGRASTHESWKARERGGAHG